MTSRWRPEPIGGPRQLEVGNDGGLIVLKDGPLFLVQPADGQGSHPEAGLYFRDTRFLNGIEWWIDEERPVVLSSAIYHMNRAQIDLTNPDMVIDGRPLLAHTLHLRLTLLVADRLYARVRLMNFSREAVPLTVKFRFAADFRDIFEIRGVVERTRRGFSLGIETDRHEALFRYAGLDDRLRTTRIVVEPNPDSWRPVDQFLEAVFHLTLPPRAKVYRYFAVAAEMGAGAGLAFGPLSRHFTWAALHQARAVRDWRDQCTWIETDNRVYNQMLRQATDDMRALMTTYPEGRIIDAGIPWYVAPFGRDAAITGIETLLLTPTIAEESLRFLAKLQGQAVNDWRDEEPGKILHEFRQGELAGAGEIPHTPYYGSIDSTLWWMIAVYETWRFTNRLDFLQEVEEPLMRAAEWVVRYGDRDGDGLLEYLRRSTVGLENQGWKDSFDSVLDEQGHIPPSPIALVEVQGYAFDAMKKAAELFRVLGHGDRAEWAMQQARALRERFLERFTSTEDKAFIYALDGQKRPIQAKTSNEGHLLFTGILTPTQARQVIRRLFQADMVSGFGIRTLAQSATFYNPMSYHNGSVWPHDNAIIAWGLKTQGAIKELMQLSQQLYEAAQYFPLGRLPELYCGFTRRSGAGPVQYPVACNPQAWSAAVPFFLLRLWLGITVHGHEVRIQQPELPPWLNELYLDRLQIAGGQLSLEFARGRGITYANVVHREGPIKVVIEPGKN